MDESLGSQADEGPLVQLFGSSGRTRIVEAFLGKRGTELTASEIAKLAGVDRSTVSRNVDELVDVGLVQRRETQSGVLYRVANDDPVVQALSDVRRELFGGLAENPELVEREPDDDPDTEAYVDRAGLVRLFGSPGRTKMIAGFLEAEGEELTGAEVARLAGIDRSTVSRNVDELVELGVIERTRRVGESELYRFADDRPIGDALLRTREELLLHEETDNVTKEITNNSTELGAEEPDIGPISPTNPFPAADITEKAIRDGGNLEAPEELDRMAMELKVELDTTRKELDSIESKFREKIEEAVGSSGFETNRAKREANRIRKQYDHLRSKYESMLRRYALLSTLKNARIHLDVENHASLQDVSKQATAQLKHQVLAEIRRVDNLGNRSDQHEDMVDDVIESIASGKFEATGTDLIDDLVREVEQDRLDPDEISLTDISVKNEDTDSAELL